MTTGPDAEFTALVHRQARFVFRVTYAVLLNSHDAEDAVQETFLKLYRNRGWLGVENERAFLARVAWRVAVDIRRLSARLKASQSEPPHALSEEFELASQHPGPEQSLLFANQHATVQSLIDALPDELRVPLVLSAFDELNSREIGRILGVPEGTVRTRIQRARHVLRQKLTVVLETRYV